MTYLLGFPSPVIESLVVILGVSLALSLYYGFQYEPIKDGDIIPGNRGTNK